LTIIFENVTEEKGKKFQKMIETIREENREGKLKCDNLFKIFEYSNSF